MTLKKESFVDKHPIIIFIGMVSVFITGLFALQTPAIILGLLELFLVTVLTTLMMVLAFLIIAVPIIFIVNLILRCNYR